MLPVRDGADFIAEALDSLIGQTFTDHEILVIDDDSHDDTRSIVGTYAARDPRVKLIRGRGTGIAETLNLGLEAVRGEFVARMDADDRSRPDRISAQLAYMEAHPSVVAVGTQIARFPNAGHSRMGRARDYPCDPAEVRRMMYRSCCIAHPSVMMRREAAIAVGGYRNIFRHAEDYDLWLRLLELGDIANIDMIGLDYRVHAAMSTVNGAEQQELEVLVARHLATLRQNGFREPVIDEMPIGRATLCKLGIDERTTVRHIRKARFKVARMLHRAGMADGRRRCLASAGPARMPGGGLADVGDFAWRWLKVFV